MLLVQSTTTKMNKNSQMSVMIGAVTWQPLYSFNSKKSQSGVLFIGTYSYSIIVFHYLNRREADQVWPIGRFSEAGLHEWMPFVIFRARGRVRSQRHFRADFLSRRYFTLCITKEVEPWIAKQCKCHHCCSCKNYWGKGMEGGKKSVFVSIFGWPQDREFVEKNAFWGIL